MFDTLERSLNGVFRRLRSRGKLHPKQVDAALDDIRTALLDADVALEVVDDFLARVRQRATSDEVMRSLTPAQQVIKVVRDELVVTLGGEHRPFRLPGANPVVIMMAGVQGSGKTTACAKLARHLKEKGKQPLLVAADLQRPAAVEQLFTLGREIGVPVVSDGKDAVKVAKNALKSASREGRNVVIVDTTFRPSREADFSAFLATFTASFPSETTGTPISRPSVNSCSTAAGRWRSAATRSGCLPFSFRWRASFAHAVVFSEPWPPAIMITTGRAPGSRKGLCSPPRVTTSASRTTLSTCWAGVSDRMTSSEVARLRTLARKSSTTSRATSASSRAVRMSSRAASTCFGWSLPLARRRR